MTNCKFRDVFEKKTCEIKCFWKFQNVFFKWSIYFSKKGQILKVLRILGQWILLVHILDENSPVLCFWIFSRMFFEYSISFAGKKNKFWTFWELLRKNTVGDAIYKRFAKVSDIWKIKFFFQKKTTFFQKIQILKVSIILKQNYNLRRILEFLLKLCVFEKFQRSFRKKPSSKRFEISWVETQFETNCISNMPN